ncbi:MAG: SWIM zinc finger family protein, partial [Polyangiales bacterium]
MSDDERRFFERGPKKPPPEHGIKMKKAGTTWWGQRWIDALVQVLGGDGGRLSRGRTYARAGRTHDLTVAGGEVTAKVTGSRATPYAVTITLPLLDDTSWQAAIAGMVAQAQFAAALLGGEMPQDIDAVFQAAGSSLFPRERRDLKTSCSCPDWGDPCKHVAATHYVLGEALDRDPFLLFELRGRTKQQVLEALRAARSGSAAAGGD